MWGKRKQSKSSLPQVPIRGTRGVFDPCKILYENNKKLLRLNPCMCMKKKYLITYWHIVITAVIINSELVELF
jgi:hypothetical protein